MFLLLLSLLLLVVVSLLPSLLSSSSSSSVALAGPALLLLLLLSPLSHPALTTPLSSSAATLQQRTRRTLMPPWLLLLLWSSLSLLACGPGVVDAVPTYYDVITVSSTPIAAAPSFYRESFTWAKTLKCFGLVDGAFSVTFTPNAYCCISLTDAPCTNWGVAPAAVPFGLNSGLAVPAVTWWVSFLRVPAGALNPTIAVTTNVCDALNCCRGPVISWPDVTAATANVLRVSTGPKAVAQIDLQVDQAVVPDTAGGQTITEVPTVRPALTSCYAASAALQFRQRNRQYIALNNSASLPGTNVMNVAGPWNTVALRYSSWSIALWLRLETAQHWSTVFACSTSDNDQLAPNSAMAFSTTVGNINAYGVWYWSADGSQAWAAWSGHLDAADNPNLVWTHFVFTFNGAGTDGLGGGTLYGTLYRNGVQIHQAVFPRPDDVFRPFCRLGRNHYGSAQVYTLDGDIARWTWWHKALTPTEAVALYNEPRPTIVDYGRIGNVAPSTGVYSSAVTVTLTSFAAFGFGCMGSIDSIRYGVNGGDFLCDPGVQTGTDTATCVIAANTLMPGVNAEFLIYLHHGANPMTGVRTRGVTYVATGSVPGLMPGLVPYWQTLWNSVVPTRAGYKEGATVGTRVITLDGNSTGRAKVWADEQMINLLLPADTGNGVVPGYTARNGVAVCLWVFVHNVTEDYNRLFQLSNSAGSILLMQTATLENNYNRLMSGYQFKFVNGVQYAAAASNTNLFEFGRWNMFCLNVAGDVTTMWTNRDYKNTNYLADPTGPAEVTAWTYARIGELPQGIPTQPYMHADIASFVIYPRALYPSELLWLYSNPPPSVAGAMRFNPQPATLHANYQDTINVICPTWFGMNPSGVVYTTLTVLLTVVTGECTLSGPTSLVFTSYGTKSFQVSAPAAYIQCIIGFAWSGASDSRIALPATTLDLSPLPHTAVTSLASASFRLMFTQKPWRVSTWLGANTCKPRNIAKFNPATQDHVLLTDPADVGYDIQPFPNTDGGITGGTGVPGSYALCTWFQFWSLDGSTSPRLFDISSTATNVDGTSFGLSGSSASWFWESAGTPSAFTTIVGSPAAALAKNRWYHLCIKWQTTSSHQKVILDGVLIDTINAGITFPAMVRARAYLGRGSNNQPNQYAPISMASFHFWNRHVPDAEVAVLYAAPPVSLKELGVGTVTPSTGTYGVPTNVVLAPLFSPWGTAGCGVPNFSWIRYGPKGTEQDCDSVSLAAYPNLICVVTNPPSGVPVRFTVAYDGMSGLTSTQTYTATATTGAQIYASAYWFTNFTTPSLHALWLPGPSRLPNTGIADVDPTTPYYLDLNDQADMHANVAFPNTFHDAFSFAFWIRPRVPGSGTFQPLMECNDVLGSESRNFFLYQGVPSNNLCLFVSNPTSGSTNRCSAAGVLTNSVWQLVSVSLEITGFLTIYVNNVVAFTTTNANSFSTMPGNATRPYCWLGKSTSSIPLAVATAQFGWTGYFRRALSAAEVALMVSSIPANLAPAPFTITNVPRGMTNSQTLLITLAPNAQFGALSASTSTTLTLTATGTFTSVSPMTFTWTNDQTPQTLTVVAVAAFTTGSINIAFALSGDVTNTLQPATIVILPASFATMANGPDAFNLNFTVPSVHGSYIGGTTCAPGAVAKFDGVSKYLDLNDPADTSGSHPLPLFGGTGGGWFLMMWLTFGAFTPQGKLFETSAVGGNDSLVIGWTGSGNPTLYVRYFVGATQTCEVVFASPDESNLNRIMVYTVMFVPSGATGQLRFHANSAFGTFSSATCPVIANVPRPLAYLGRGVSGGNFWNGQVLSFTFIPRALLQLEWDAIRQGPVSAQRGTITGITPATGAFNSIVPVTLTILNLNAVCTGADITAIYFGRLGSGAICSDVVFNSPTNISCNVDRDVHLSVPMKFRLEIQGTVSLTSSNLYTAGLVGATTLRDNAVALVRFHNPTLVNAQWLPGPSQTPGTGIASLSGSQFINLTLVADTGVVFPSTFNPLNPLNIINQWTFNFWLQDTSGMVGMDSTIFACTNSAPVGFVGIQLRRTGINELLFSYFDGAGGISSGCPIATANTAIKFDTWQMLTVALDSTQMIRIYSNAVAIAVCMGNRFVMTSPRDQCSLGRSHHHVGPQTSNFVGYFAEFATFNHELTQPELLRLYTDPPPAIAPAQFVITRPPIVAIGASVSYTIRAPVYFGGGVTLNVTATLATVTSPTSFVFGLVSGGAQTLTLTIDDMPVLISFIKSGTDTLRFTLPAPITVANTILLTFSAPDVYSLQHFAFTSAISKAVASDMVITVTASTGSLVLGSQVITSVSGLTNSWMLHAPLVVGPAWSNVTFQTNISGPGAADWVIPPAQTLFILPRATLTSVVPWAPSVYRNSTFPVEIHPSTSANLTGVDVTLFVDSVLHSTITLPPNSLTPLTFWVQAPPTLANLSLSWSLSGADADHFLLPANHTVRTIPTQSFAWFGVPEFVNISTVAHSLPLTETPTPSQLSQFVFQIRPMAVPTGSGIIGASIRVSSADGYVSPVDIVWTTANWTEPANVTYTASNYIQPDNETFSLVFFGPLDTQAEYISTLPTSVCVRGMVLLAGLPQLGGPGLPGSVPQLGGLYNDEPATTSRIHLIGTALLVNRSLSVTMEGRWHLDGAPISGVVLSKTVSFIVTPATSKPLFFSNPSVFTVPAAALAALSIGWPSGANLTMELVWTLGLTNAFQFITPVRSFYQSIIPYFFDVELPPLLYTQQPLFFTANMGALVPNDLTLTATSSSGEMLVPSVNMTVGDVVSPSFELMPPPLAHGDAWVVVNLSIALSGPDRYRYVLVRPLNVTIVPREVFAVSYWPTNPPSFIYVNETFWVTLQPSSYANFTGITIRALNQGVLDGVAQTLPNNSVAPLVFPIVAPTSVQTINVSWNMNLADSPDYYHFQLPQWFMVPVLPREVFLFTTYFDRLPAATNASFGIQPGAIPTGTGFIGLVLSVSAGTLSQYRVVWSTANWTTAVQIEYRATDRAALVNLSYAYSSAYDVNAEYILPDSKIINVLVAWDIRNVPLVPSGMYPGQPTTSLVFRPFGLAPSAASQGATIDVGVRSYWVLDGQVVQHAALPNPVQSWTMPYFNFSEFTQQASMDFTFPRTLPPGIDISANLTYGRLVLLVNFTVSGLDAWRTAVPSAMMIPVLWPGFVALKNIPVSLYGTQPWAFQSALWPFGVNPNSYFVLQHTVVSGGGFLHSHPDGKVNFSTTTGGSQQVRLYYFAPDIAAPSTVTLKQSMLNDSAAGEYWRFYLPPVPASYSVNLVPQSIFFLTKPINRVYTFQPFEMTLLPSDVAKVGGISVSALFNLQVTLGGNGTNITTVTQPVTQRSLDYTPVMGIVPLVFSDLIAPSNPQQLLIQFNHSGTDYYHFRPLAPFNFTIWPQATWVVSSLPAGAVYTNQNFSVVITPSEAADFSGVDVTLYIDRMPVQTLSMPAGTLAPITFKAVAPATEGFLNLTFSVSGSDRFHYAAPSNYTIQVIQPAPFNITGPAAVNVGSSVTYFYRPSLPLQGVGFIALRLTGLNGLLVEPAYISWVHANYTTFFAVRFTAPDTARFCSVSYELAGPYDSVAQFAPGPVPTVIAVRGFVAFSNASFSATGAGVQGLYTSEPSKSTMVSLRNVTAAPALNFTMHVQAFWHFNVATPPSPLPTDMLFQTAVPFKFTIAPQSLTFVIPHRNTLPESVLASYPTGPGTTGLQMRLQFSFSGQAAALFVEPAALYVPVWLPQLIRVPLPVAMYTRNLLAVNASLTAPVPLDLSLNISVSVGSMLQPALQSFAVSTLPSELHFTYSPPVIPLRGQPITATFSLSLSGADRYRFYASPSPTAPTFPQVLVRPQQNFSVQYSPLVLYTNHTWLVSLLPSAVANFTGLDVTVYFNGVAQSTVRMQPATLVPVLLPLFTPGSSGPLNVTFSLSGDDYAHFEVPPPLFLSIRDRVPFVITGFPASNTIVSGQNSGTITFAPSEAPDATVTLSMAVFFKGLPASGIASSTGFNFLAGQVSPWGFNIQGPSVTQDYPLLLHFTLSGPDANHFITPDAKLLTIQYPKAYFVIQGLEGGKVYSTLPVSLTIQMIQPLYLGTPVTLSMVNLLDPAQAPVKVLSFAFASTQSFTVTMPAFSPALGNSTLLGFTVSDPLHFTAPEITPTWYAYPLGFWGPDVKPCLCGPQGTCSEGPSGTGACACVPRWGGPRCDNCAVDFFGPTCQPCTVTCPSGISKCDDGVAGTGVCVCFPGFTGVTCQDCLPQHWGSQCLSCPVCERGACEEGRTGRGCVCEPGWTGPTCSSIIPGALVTFFQSVSGYDGEFVLIKLNASLASFTAKVLSLPSVGTLFQTADGATPGNAISAPGTTVLSLNHELLLLMPSVYDPAAASTGLPLTEFSWYASTPSFGISGSATVSVFALHVNQAPVLKGTAIAAVAFGSPITVMALESTPVFIGGMFALSDPDAGTAAIEVVVRAERGYFMFDAAVLNPALFDGIQPLRNTSALLPVSAFTASPAPHVLRPSLNLTSSVANLNRLLSGLWFVPNPFASGGDSLGIFASDLGHSGTDGAEPRKFAYPKFVAVWVEKVNQPIVLVAGGAANSRPDLISWSSPVVAQQSTPLPNLRLEAFDSDSFFGTDTLEMSVSHGTIAFEAKLRPTGPDGLALKLAVGGLPTFAIGTGTGDAHVLVDSTVASVNALLRNFTYTPTIGYIGPDFLVVRINDNGNSGGGGPTQIVRTYSINVLFKDTPPLAVDEAVNMLEDGRTVVGLRAIDTATQVVVGAFYRFSITSLPPQNRAMLYQIRPGSPANTPDDDLRRGVAITHVPTVLDDLEGRVMIRLAPFLHGFNLTSFTYTATKFPSALQSLNMGRIMVSVTHVNHPPFVEHLTDASGIEHSDPARNRYIVRKVFSNTDLELQLHASDVDANTTLSYFVMSLPLRGKLFQYLDLPPGPPILTPNPVLGQPTVVMSVNRGPEITRNGTKVSSALARLVYAPVPGDFYAIPAVYASFMYAADDGASQSAPFPIYNFLYKPAVYPIAPNISSQAAQDTDVTLYFDLAPAQSLHMSLGSVTLTSLPSSGAVFLVNSWGNRGAQITSTPFTLALPGSLAAAQPSASVAVVPAVAVIYAPPAGVFGTNVATLLYTVTDRVSGLTSHVDGRATFSFLRVNRAPVSTPLALLNVAAQIILDLEVSDPDNLNSELTIKILTLPAQGMLQRMDGSVINTPGSTLVMWGAGPTFKLRYTPTVLHFGPYFTSFKFVASDGHLLSQISVVSLMCHASTLPPVSVGASYALLEGDLILLDLRAYDPKNFAHPTVILQTLPTRGTLLGVNGLPLTNSSRIAADYWGRHNAMYRAGDLGGQPLGFDSFTFRSQESAGGLSVGNTATVSFNISHRRLSPVPLFNPWRVDLVEDTSHRIVLNGTSREAFTISANILSLPAAGTLYRTQCGSGAQGSAITAVGSLLPCAGERFVVVMFVPPLHTFGDPARDSRLASFTYELFDGVLRSETAVVNLHVLKFNYLPIATPLSLSTPEGKPLLITAQCMDLNGAPQTAMYAVITAYPQWGLLYHFDESAADESTIGRQITLLNNGRVTDPSKRMWYIANFARAGPDALEYRCHLFEAFITSVGLPVSVGITVHAVADPPVLPFTSVRWNITQNALGIIALPFVDTENSGQLSVQITSLPARGQLFQIVPHWELNPNATSNPNAIEFGVNRRRMFGMQDDGDFASTNEAPRRKLLAVDLSTPASANPVLSPSVEGGWAAIPTVANSVVFPSPTPQQVLYSTSNSRQNFAVLPFGAPIGSLGVAAWVTNPQFLVGFLPREREAFTSKDNFYAKFEYKVTDQRSGLTTPGVAVVNIHVPPVFLPPLALGFTTTTLENTATVIFLQGIASDGSLDVSAVVARYPTYGTLCQFAQPAGFEAGKYPSLCGLGYGAMAVAGSPVADPTLRIVYRPALNMFGADSFGFKVSNTDFSLTPSNMPANVRTSIEGVVDIDVIFVNQPPKTNSSLVTYMVPVSTGLLTVALHAEDPDDSLDSMTFLLTSMRGPGLFWFNRTYSVGSQLRWTISSINANTTFPYRLPSGVRTLHFDANQEGNAFPYSRLAYTVIDGSMRNNVSDWIQLQNDCGVLSYKNVWSPGPLCRNCPTGATCSSSGEYLPMSQRGFWKSDRLGAEQQPIYIACQPAEACTGDKEYNSTDQCAFGFTGRICGDCQANFYLNDRSCKSCASAYSFWMQVLIFIVPAIVVLAILFLVIVHLQLEMTFFAILVNFFQLVSTFKQFQLGWLSDTQSIFNSLSFLMFNIELLQLRCQIPSLTYMGQWVVFMLIPWGVLLVLMLLLYSFGVGWSIVEWRKQRGKKGMEARTSLAVQFKRNHRLTRKNLNAKSDSAADPIKPTKSTEAELDKNISNVGRRESLFLSASPDDPSKFLSPALALTLAPIATPPAHPGPKATLSQARAYKHKYQLYLNDLAEALNIVPTGEIVDGVAFATLADLQAARFYAPPPPPRTFRAILWHRLIWAHQMVVHAEMVLLNLLYLALAIKAMEPLKCTDMPDGSSVLDAVPALSCDDPWWTEWAPIVFFAACFYSGILLLFFAYIMFKQRPPSNSVRFCQWLYFPVQLIGGKLRDQIWRSGPKLHRRDSTYGSAKQFVLAQKVTAWQLRYRSMTSPFRPHYYFWTLTLKIFSLMIALIAVWLSSYPIYQAVFAILTLGVATILQFKNNPFRQGTGMNELALVTNLCAVAIIFMGLLFNADNTPGDASFKYPFVRTFLNHLLQAFMALCILMTIGLLRRQLGQTFPDSWAFKSERAVLRKKAEDLRKRDAMAVYTMTIEKEIASDTFACPMTAQTESYLRNDVAAVKWLAELNHLYTLPKPQRKFLYAGTKDAVVGGHTKETVRVNRLGELQEEDSGSAEPSQVAVTGLDDEERLMEQQALDAAAKFQRQLAVRVRSSSTDNSPTGTPRGELDRTRSVAGGIAPEQIEGFSPPAFPPRPLADARAESLLGAPGVRHDAPLLDDLAPGIRALVLRARLASARKYAEPLPFPEPAYDPTLNYSPEGAPYAGESFQCYDNVPEPAPYSPQMMPPPQMPSYFPDELQQYEHDAFVTPPPIVAPRPPRPVRSPTAAPSRPLAPRPVAIKPAASAAPASPALAPAPVADVIVPEPKPAVAAASPSAPRRKFRSAAKSVAAANNAAAAFAHAMLLDAEDKAAAAADEAAFAKLVADAAAAGKRARAVPRVVSPAPTGACASPAAAPAAAPAAVLPSPSLAAQAHGESYDSSSEEDPDSERERAAREMRAAMSDPSPRSDAEEPGAPPPSAAAATAAKSAGLAQPVAARTVAPGVPPTHGRTPSRVQLHPAGSSRSLLATSSSSPLSSSAAPHSRLASLDLTAGSVSPGMTPLASPSQALRLGGAVPRSPSLLSSNPASPVSAAAGGSPNPALPASRTKSSAARRQQALLLQRQAMELLMAADNAEQLPPSALSAAAPQAAPVAASPSPSASPASASAASPTAASARPAVGRSFTLHTSSRSPVAGAAVAGAPPSAPRRQASSAAVTASPSAASSGSSPAAGSPTVAHSRAAW